MKIPCIHAGTIIVIPAYSNMIIVSLKRNEIPRCLTDLLILTFKEVLLIVNDFYNEFMNVKENNTISCGMTIAVYYYYTLVWRMLSWVIYFTYNITAGMYSYTPEVILLLVLIKYAKMSYFVPLGYIAVVGIQVEKPPGNPYEKYRGVLKGV